MRSPYFSYRPLRCGIAITSAGVGQYGTIGFFGRSADGAVWLVSCYHVLCRVDFSAFSAGESVFQPDDATAVVAKLVDRADVDLDCAAARLQPGIEGVNEILGLGVFNRAPREAAVGMRVFKFGAITELTEGVVASVSASKVEIEAPPSFSAPYELSRIGDSGALWLEEGSLRPVALHRQGDGEGRRAVASPLAPVLKALRLELA